MRKQLKIVMFVFLIFATSALKSQTKLEFNLQGAIDYAIKNNSIMQNARLSVIESKYKHRESISSGLPQVDAAIDYQNFFNSSASIGMMEFVFNPTSNANLQVGQLIFSGNYILGIQMAALYKEMSEVNLKKTESDIRTQIRSAYTMVLVAQETKKLINSNIKNLQEVLAKTKTLVDVGILESTDFDQVKIQLGMLENTLKTIERQHELATNLFRLQLGLNKNQEFVLTENLNELLLRATFELSSSLEQVSTTTNPEYQLLQIQRELSKKSVDMELMSFLPTISAFYNYTYKIKRAELDFAPKHVIGLNVSIPIFSSGKRYYKHQQAKIRHLSTINTVELATEQLQVREKQLRFNLQNNMEQLELQRKNIELSKRVYNNIYNKFQEGLVSSIDLTTANSNYLQTENNYISAVMQFLESKNELDKLLNK